MTFESAAYVARYSLKKVSGAPAASHYEWTDPETGELHQLKPEFMRCSLNPAVGKHWIGAYAEEVRSSDSVVARGREMKPPRYYDKKIEATTPEEWERISAARRVAADARFDEGSTSRLAAREAVKQALVSTKKRALK